MVSRRNFIKSGCAACLGLAGGSLLLESCATQLPLWKASPDAQQLLRVPADQFADGQTMVLVRANTLENDILLRKVGDEYIALYLHCTHEGMGLIPTTDRIYCNAHGSVFDLDGEVVREPAASPLKRFKTIVGNQEIQIQLT